MIIGKLMTEAGFDKWLTPHKISGYQRPFSMGKISRLAVIPVNGKTITSLNDKVLALSFNDAGDLLYNMFFDTLEEFLELLEVEITERTRHAANQYTSGVLGSLRGILTGITSLFQRCLHPIFR